jgi:ferrochelatase
VKTAVVLFNLGGPDRPEAVKPFLTNLFSDPAIIGLPGPLRWLVPRLIAGRRAPLAREIYGKIGGGSPIVPETEAQAEALDAALALRGLTAKSFIAMRYWTPFSDQAAAEVRAWGAEEVVLLPLYPQFSTTTTASSLADWRRAAKAAGLELPEARACCYPRQPGFIAAEVRLVREALAQRKPGLPYRVLFSAHGLPEVVVERGDPYQWQVERTAGAIVDGLGISGLDWNICYQSRVGPMKWIGPATDAEIRRAGEAGTGLIVVPIAFVSEHSETLVELDIEYARLAKEVGAPDYIRVPTVGTAPEFIEGLADLVMAALGDARPATCGSGRICPAAQRRCGYGG